ncbi:hypothetical protein VB005_04259 [Metarhizium brunneum]
MFTAAQIVAKSANKHARESRVASGNKKTVEKARTCTLPPNNEDTREYHESPESDHSEGSLGH